MADKCKHDRLLTFKGATTQEPVGLWACATCRVKFVPLDLAMEKDAERYRWLRDKMNGDNQECVHDATGSQLLGGAALDAALDLVLHNA